MGERKRDIRARLDAEGILCAEGYLFEMERRGYLAAGAYVPEVVLENRAALRQLHVDFQHAGSDVMQAFTYHGHREKMRVLGKEGLLEPLNREALRLAKEVAEAVPDGREPNLLAGNICSTAIWDPGDAGTQREARAMFDEMVGWAAEEGADYVVAETFYYGAEALSALEAIRAAGLDAVVTLAPMQGEELRDGRGIVETCKELERAGAVAVGMNCFRGPRTMMPWVRKIREAVGCHVAALPVTYRTTPEHQTYFSLPDGNGCTCPSPHGRPYPTALDPMRTNRYEIRAFAQEAWGMGCKYLGVCCGAAPADVREVAEAMGREPPASRFREDMALNSFYGTHGRIPSRMRDMGRNA